MDSKPSLAIAMTATLHCLTGCGIGEVLGSVIGSGLNWSNTATEMLTIPLAFMFGYAFTSQALIRKGMSTKQSVRIALSSDSVSILSMEIIDTIIILSIPGALAAGPATALFWVSLGIALAGAFIVTVPVNYYLILKGKGHAVVHGHHQHHH